MAQAELIQKINTLDLEGLKELLCIPRYKVAVDTPDNNGSTPLFYAAWHGRDDMCFELIQAGANPFMQIKKYRAIHIAASKNHPKIVELLIQAGDKLPIEDLERMKHKGLHICTEIWHLASQSRISITPNQFNFSIDDETTTHEIQEIKTATSSASCKKDHDSQQNLFEAAENGNISRIEELLNNGADINVVGTGDYEGMTPLHIASHNNQYRTVLFLVKHGAQFVNQAQSPNSLRKHWEVRIPRPPPKTAKPTNANLNQLAQHDINEDIIAVQESLQSLYQQCDSYIDYHNMEQENKSDRDGNTASVSSIDDYLKQFQHHVNTNSIQIQPVQLQFL